MAFTLKDRPKKAELFFGDEAINNLITGLFSKAANAIDICIDLKSPFAAMVKNLVPEAFAKGIKIRFIVDMVEENVSECLELMKFGELRHHSEITGCVVQSEKECVITTSPRSARQAIYSSDSEMLGQQKNIFDSLWMDASPMQKRILEIQSGTKKEEVEIIRSTVKIRNLYLDAVNSARFDILLMWPTVNAFFRNERLGMLQLLKDHAKRGVKVKLLTPVNQDVKSRLDELLPHEIKNIEVRTIDSAIGPKATVLIVDKKISLIMEIRDDSRENFVDAVQLATYSTNALPYIFIFSEYWKQTESYDRLKKADKLKEEFINIAAHELRTPIMPILGGLELLKDKISGEKSDEVKEDFNIIYRNANRLKKLAEDILEVSKIESGNFKLNIAEVDINTIILDVMHDIERQSGGGRKKVSQDGDLYSLIVSVIGDIEAKNEKIPILFSPSSVGNLLRCDAGKISQVLFNLVNNALKFTEDAAGRVIISITVPDENNIVVTVKDRGKGIDPMIKEKMFDKFVSKSEGGTGLGLYITKKIVETHGGRIWGENNIDGKGAVFSFSLPLSPFSKITYYEDYDREALLQREIDRNKGTLETMRKDAMERIDIMKKNLLLARDHALRRRTEAIEEYQHKVEHSRELLKTRQELLNEQINYDRMRRNVDSRIERGLDGLGRLIEGLRVDILGNEALDKLAFNPAVSDAITSEAKKVTDTDFFKSLQKQLEIEAGSEQ